MEWQNIIVSYCGVEVKLEVAEYYGYSWGRETGVEEGDMILG